MVRKIRDIDFLPELIFQTSRSGGKGGQNVNKVNSRVELFFNVITSQLLFDDEKQRLSQKLESRLSTEGVIRLYSGKSRSQFENKELVINRFYDLIEKALTVNKVRKATKPTKASLERRIQEKKKQGKTKALRYTPPTE